jgi:uncharacterized membrane protein YbhN (UPF0104 family)
VLALVARRLQVAEVGRLLGAADLRWVALIVALAPLQYMLAGLRWRWVSEALGTPLPARRAIREVGLSTLLNQVLPGGMTGDAIRVWRQARQQPAIDAFRAAVIDRGMGLWVHVAITLLGLAGAAYLGFASYGEAAGVALLAVLLSTVVAWRGRMGTDVRRVLARSGGWVLGSSVVLLVSLLVSFGAAGAAVGQPLGWWVPLAVPVVLLAMVVPLSVGGWGLREAGAVALLPRFDWSPEEALAASTVYGLACLVGTLPGAWPLVEGRTG